MPEYVFTYYGEPRFESPETCSTHMAKWEAWISGPGNALVNPGIPLGRAQDRQVRWGARWS